MRRCSAAALLRDQLRLARCPGKNPDGCRVDPVSTLQRRLATIREAHRYAGHDLDTASVAFRDAWRGIRNAHGAPAAQKAALLTADLRRAVAALPDTLTGRRDRALLLVGFAAALRRAELAALEVAPRRRAGLD